MDYHCFKVNLLVRISKKVGLANGRGCRLWEGCVKSGGRYGVIHYKYPGCTDTVSNVHRVVYMLEHNDFNLAPGLEVSHLCHEPLCLTVQHLNAEPHSVNMSRAQCVFRAKCTGHAPHPNCLF